MLPITGAHLFGILGFFVVLGAFMVTIKTLGSIEILFSRLEYLLFREFELVKEKEKIKSSIIQRREKEKQKEQKRRAEMDPLLHIPYEVKK